MTRVGFIGLGNQGAPIARRIVEAGFPLTLWARRPESLEPFAETAATVASTPSELGAACDVVSICVFADDDVRDVLLQPNGVLAGMAAGGVVAIHSTVHPRTVRELTEEAATRGVDVVDAPVSGGADVAAAGKLLVMTGGDEAAVERCRPVFATFGEHIVHLGPVGSAQIAKVINNLLLAANMSAAIEAFDFAAALGLDLPGLADALAHGTGGSAAAGIVAAASFNGAAMRAGTAPYFRKDLEMVVEVAEYGGAAPPAPVLEYARLGVPPADA